MVYFGKDVDNFSVIRMIRIVGVEMNDKFMVRGVLVFLVLFLYFKRFKLLVYIKVFLK